MRHTGQNVFFFFFVHSIQYWHERDSRLKRFSVQHHMRGAYNSETNTDKRQFRN